MERYPVVAGRFYPEHPAQLQREIEKLFAQVKHGNQKSVRAVIAPHAGYLFSGGVAASAYAQIEKNTQYKRVFLIGSSHTSNFKGASVYCSGDFIMPYGKERVDTQLGKELVNNHPHIFTSNPSPHIREHSLEVQLPFINYRLKKDYLIIPILIGCNDSTVCESVAEALKPYFVPENLFVISSDFSHYPGYDDAKKVDKVTMEAILTNDPEILTDALIDNKAKRIKGLSTSLCGASSVLVLMHLSKNNPAYKYRAIEYKNSGDNEIYGENDRVVGYWAIVLTAKAEIREENTLTISNLEKETLLRVARESIKATVLKKGKGRIRIYDTSGVLSLECGAFVTIHKKGKLRGCIGRIESSLPLYKTVEEVAALAAYYDNRFKPVEPHELDELEIEVSILSPPVKIDDISQIKLGVHGIIIRKGVRSGVFLPQVALDTGWSLEEFLGYCSSNKAGLGWDGWREADLYIFTSTLLS